MNHLDERYDGQRPDIIDNSFTTVDFANGVHATLDPAAEIGAREHRVVTMAELGL